LFPGLCTPEGAIQDTEIQKKQNIKKNNRTLIVTLLVLPHKTKQSINNIFVCLVCGLSFFCCCKCCSYCASLSIDAKFRVRNKHFSIFNSIATPAAIHGMPRHEQSNTFLLKTRLDGFKSTPRVRRSGYRRAPPRWDPSKRFRGMDPK